MDRHLLAVMPDVDSANQLARTLLDRGMDADRIRVDDEADEADALWAEMAAETTDSVIAPQAVYIASKEGNRGAVFVSLVVASGALVVAALAALVDVGLNYWARFAFEGGFLVFLSIIMGYMHGAAWAWDPEQKMAAERGVVVRIADASPDVAETVIDAGPIRLDEVSVDGGPVAAVHDEGAAADHDLARKLGDTVGHMRHAIDDERHADPTDHT